MVTLMQAHDVVSATQLNPRAAALTTQSLHLYLPRPPTLRSCFEWGFVSKPADMVRSGPFKSGMWLEALVAPQPV